MVDARSDALESGRHKMTDRPVRLTIRVWNPKIRGVPTWQSDANVCVEKQTTGSSCVQRDPQDHV